jgi:hypothetical protein
MGAVEKARIRNLLLTRDRDALIAWAKGKGRALHILYGFTYDGEPLVVWRALAALGSAAAVKADADPERVRDFVRHCIWMMNDESGGLGWRSPEVIGEVLLGVPALIDEYASLLPHYLEESPFEAGATFALYRLGRRVPGLIAANRDTLERMLRFDAAAARAYGAIALIESGIVLGESITNPLLKDGSHVAYYDFETGRLAYPSVSTLVRSALWS